MPNMKTSLPPDFTVSCIEMGVSDRQIPSLQCKKDNSTNWPGKEKPLCCSTAIRGQKAGNAELACEITAT